MNPTFVILLCLLFALVLFATYKQLTTTKELPEVDLDLDPITEAALNLHGHIDNAIDFKDHELAPDALATMQLSYEYLRAQLHKNIRTKSPTAMEYYIQTIQSQLTTLASNIPQTMNNKEIISQLQSQLNLLKTINK